jgi:hypothetical protein
MRITKDNIHTLKKGDYVWSIEAGPSTVLSIDEGVIQICAEGTNLILKQDVQDVFDTSSPDLYTCEMFADTEPLTEYELLNMEPGTKVWSIHTKEWMEILSVRPALTYCIFLGVVGQPYRTLSTTSDGKLWSSDVVPSLYRKPTKLISKTCKFIEEIL